jgi:GntR family histidine utilization transcriptional repressor
LALSLQADILHLKCLHYAGSKPFQFEDRWINLDAVPKAAGQNFDTIGPNEWLVQEVPFTEAELTFSSMSADLQISELLGVSEGAALFTIERITWLETQPITFAKLHYFSGYQMTSRL